MTSNNPLREPMIIGRAAAVKAFTDSLPHNNDETLVSRVNGVPIYTSERMPPGEVWLRNADGTVIKLLVAREQDETPPIGSENDSRGTTN